MACETASGYTIIVASAARYPCVQFAGYFVISSDKYRKRCVPLGAVGAPKSTAAARYIVVSTREKRVGEKIRANIRRGVIWLRALQFCVARRARSEPGVICTVASSEPCHNLPPGPGLNGPRTKCHYTFRKKMHRSREGWS